MSSQKKASVLLHADFIDDPPLGYNKDALDLISEHFNIVWLKEVERDPALGKQVEGIFLKPGRHVKILDRLDCFPNAKVLVNNGVGYDHVPVKRLADRGIRVGNTPRVLAESVADMAMCLLLASARDLLQGKPFRETIHLVIHTCAITRRSQAPPPPSPGEYHIHAPHRVGGGVAVVPHTVGFHQSQASKGVSINV